MKSIPLRTEVLCTDGPAGKPTCVIVEPATLRFTHFVVADRKRPHTERIVPREQMVDKDPNSIRLARTRDELAEMRPFIRTTFRQIEIPRYAGHDLSPSVGSEQSLVEVEVEQVPAGEVAIREGSDVEAVDGSPLGHVVELVADPGSGMSTHVVLREGRLWGQKDVLVPVSAVKEVHKGKMRLTLNQETLAGMLAILTRWHAAEANLELVTSTFADEKGARDAPKVVKKLSKEGEFEILNAAVLIRDADGDASFRKTEDVDPARGTLFGAVAGGLIGLAGGPLGALLGAAAGAVTGGAAAKWIDMGFSDEYLQNLAERLRPETSTLLTLVGAEHADWVAAALENLDGRVCKQTLDSRLIDQLTAEQQPDPDDFAPSA